MGGGGKSSQLGPPPTITLNPQGKQREKYINDFYGKLYKKRLDRLISIEDFLDRAGDDADLQSKKLSEGERMSLEGKVTLDELEKSLAKSNMNSACVL